MDIQKHLKQVLVVLTKAPIEISFGVCAFIWYILSEQADVFILRKFWELFILGEMFIYSCNYLGRSKRSLALYIISPILFGGIVWGDQVSYSIDLASLNSILIFTFLLFSYNWFSDNRKYAINALNIGVSFVTSILLSLSIYLAIIGTYYSITSIFVLRSSNSFYEDAAALCYFIMVPFFFLFLRLQQKEKHDIITISKSHPISIFINYILSPAIIIYTAILYIYLYQITILWILPEGAIAVMVFALNISILVAELIRSILPSNILLINRYFRYFHILVVPLLLLFWIAVYQRISYYSFSENRIYLILAGIAMTWFVFSHYSKQTYKFLYLAIFTITLFSTMTFIPGITAKDIAEELYQPTEDSITTRRKQNLIVDLYLTGEISIQRMNKLRTSSSYYSVEDSIISVNDNGDPMFNINIKKYLEQKLKEYNIDIKENINLNEYHASKRISDKDFGRIEIGSDTIIILKSISLDFPDSRKDDYKIRNIRISAMLTK